MPVFMNLLSRSRCRQCGRHEKPWNYLAEQRLCLGCYAEQVKDSRERAVSLLGVSPVHCHQALPGKVHKTPMLQTLGDLFVTSGGLVYIPYTDLSLAGSHDVGSASFLYGLIGGIGALLGNTMDVQEQQKVAESMVERAREADYGMTVEDRVRLRGGVVIPWSDIRSVEENPERDSVRIAHGAGDLELTGSLVRKTTVEQWAVGNIRDEPDRRGANLGLASTSRFLDHLEGQRICDQLTSNMENLIASNREYAANVFAVFKYRRARQQKAAIRAIAEMPAAFLDVFRGKLDQERKIERRRFAYVILGLGASAMAFLWFLSRAGWGSGSTIEEVGCLPTLVGMVAGLGLLLFSIPSIGFGGRWSRYGHLLSQLAQHRTR